ncbi:MAG: RNA 2',3'-cyclic phosphodiesterase [Candidatus Omnitrophota bacterium]|nr:RNA 2',3'-cyclic phosphodiesterase [Candidatus Omnitrophota bacterium]MBU1929551.1 RNA 2',3'-cyclic phosphodiesterase [Candidatus Omnitrophota bacterium]MBU2035797.1 RNA 2',3'-cyclic phosphodiesterase [Candidatus Omnitrophota bacterium]MBU2221650.1 RNA 2',3'-cyclic phosphodiesterase [Candidatus Omnitrophota bacterium]MBU2258916.1 RNA 2',3'-cyclic phosphodiesterase [Candidatus Omnitrophota bacterium]
MRAFIAIELPKEIKEFLSDIQKRLTPAGADVRWVKPDNIHLTLKFLGEINPEALDQTIQSLEKIAADRKAFYLSLSSVGVFPKIESPKVVWIGINKGSSEIREVAGEIGKDDLSAHITLGRVKSKKNLGRLVDILKVFEVNPQKTPQECLVNKITIFKSTLLPDGPVYEILKEVNLRTI